MRLTNHEILSAATYDYPPADSGNLASNRLATMTRHKISATGAGTLVVKYRIAPGVALVTAPIPAGGWNDGAVWIWAGVNQFEFTASGGDVKVDVYSYTE